MIRAVLDWWKEGRRVLNEQQEATEEEEADEEDEEDDAVEENGDVHQCSLVTAAVRVLDALTENDDDVEHAVVCAAPRRAVPYRTAPYRAVDSLHQQTRSHPEMVGDMSRVTLNFDLSKIPFVHF